MGPQPKKVYLRRRLIVLGVLVAIIAIVVLIIVRPGSGAQGETPVAGPTSSAGAADGTAGGAAGGADAAAGAADPSAAPGTVDSASQTPPGEVAACAAGNVSIAPVTDADTYAAGVMPKLSFTITNTGSEACKLNAGTSQQVYTITSGSETYWISTDCQTDPTDTEAVLEPGVAVSSTPFAWDRTRSAADTCMSSARPAVPAAGASYHLSVSVAGIPSADTKQFILS